MRSARDLALASIAIAACAHGPASDAARSSQLAPGDYDFAITHGGRHRHYLVHVPPQAGDARPLPAIVNFHGGGANAATMRDWTNMSPLADRYGILIVFPDGTGPTVMGRAFHTWNAGACCGPAAKQQVDDVGFTFAVLADLSRRTPVDPTRVYATGLSNGAMMAQRLAHDAPARIAAIASISGANDLGDAPLVPPVPLMHIHSVDDPRALYAGGLGPPFPMTGQRVNHPSAEKVVRAWAKADGCADEPTIGETLRGQAGGPDANHTATPLSWHGCRGNSAVVLWRLTGSGHVWPGAESLLPKLLGEATHVIDANQELWKFFQRFQRTGAPPL